MQNRQRKPQVKGMKRATIIKLLTTGIILVTLLAFAAPVAAETVAAEDLEAEEFYYRRAIAEEFMPYKATVVSAKQTPEGSDFIVFVLDTKGDDDKGLGAAVLYGHGNAAADSWEHATGTFIAPLGLVEFVDDGDGQFTLGGNNGETGDDVISVLPLRADLDDHNGFYKQTGESDTTMTWLPRPEYENVVHERVNGPQDTTEINLAAQTSDGIFELRMHITNSVLLSEDLVLSPYEIKLDFVINDYPFHSEDSILGLCSIVASANANWNTGLPKVYDDWRSNVAEDGLYFDMGDVSDGVGYFSWYKNATLDGISTPVEHSTLAQFSGFEWTQEKTTRIDLKYVAFTYGRASSIIHDPKLGFAFEDIPVAIQRLVRGNIGAFMLSAFVFVGMVVGVRWYRRRSSTPKRVQVPPPQMPPQMPPQTPPQAPPQAPPQVPPQMPPTGPNAAPQQVGFPPQIPPGPPGGAQ
jgi:hypothetical protein